MDKLNVLTHQIYECRKGVRSMALCSLPVEYRQEAVNKILKNNLDYMVLPINSARINIFFGDSGCVRVAAAICDKPLNELTPEEDFILGTLLGYGIREQCERYLYQKRTLEEPVLL